MNELTDKQKGVIRLAADRLSANGAYALSDSLRGILNSIDQRRIQPEATKPAQDLGAAIRAAIREEVRAMIGANATYEELSDWLITEHKAAAAPASHQPVAKVLTDTQEAAFELAAKTIELFDDKTMENDYMLDSSECAGIIRALKPSVIAAIAASTPTTLTEKK